MEITKRFIFYKYIGKIYILTDIYRNCRKLFKKKLFKKNDLVSFSVKCISCIIKGFEKV